MSKAHVMHNNSSSIISAASVQHAIK